jgi:hypothetical protein
LLIHKKTKTMAGLLLVSAAFNITLNSVLLPRLGVVAAAASMVLGNALCVLLLSRASAKMLPVGVNVQSAIRYAIAATVAYVGMVQIEFQTPAGTVVGRAAMGVLLYVFSLLILDSRARGLAKKLIAVPAQYVRNQPAAQEAVARSHGES